MEGLKLKEDLISIRERLVKVENDLQHEMKEFSSKEEKWKIIDAFAEDIKANNNYIVKFNISGKVFMTRISTLLSIKNTLFYKMITSREVDFTEEIFFDRNPKYFEIILDYMRTKNFNILRYSSHEKNQIRIEAEYFEIEDLLDIVGNPKNEIEFIGYTSNAPYVSSGLTIGTNKVEDLSDISMMKGICANTPGWIIIELNAMHNISQIIVGGYKGNTTYWSPDNGNGSTISVSSDKSKWTRVGCIPSGFGSSPQQVKFTNVDATYIKFDCTSYLGIGYLKVK